MQDWLFRRGRRERVVDWLGLDSRIDSTLAETWAWFRDFWNAGTSFFARFRLSGWKRLLNEAASEGLTLCAGGFIVMFALAIPAFQEFNEGKFLTGQFAVKFLDQNGNEIGKRGILHNDAVPLDDIPDAMVKAALATEDRRFFEHWGIDVYGTFRALATNLQANEVVQGGSSITQQVAKNLFLSSERSLQRKIKEAFLALLLESRFTKREILKFYFDRAYMGGGAFGVEAAAQYYFGKSVRQINLAEAALLAGLFKAPTKYAPHVNLPASRARTNEVLNNLVEAGFYTSGQVHWARVHPAKTIENRNPNSADWFLDWAFEEVQRIAAGRGAYVLTARTTVDLNMQKTTDEALTSALAQVPRQPHHQRRHRADGDGRRGARHHRRPGLRREPVQSCHTRASPARLLVQGLRLCRGARERLHADHLGARRLAQLRSLASAELRRQSRRRRPHAAVEWRSPSRSTPWPPSCPSPLGRDKVIEMTRRVGITGIRKTCSMALGDYGISPLEHAGGIATFANGGKLAKPYAILDLVSSKGDLVYSRDRDEPEAPQVVERKVAEGLNWMMNKVITEGTGQRAQLDFTNVAGKTGTSTGPKDVWFVGFTGKYVGAVWLGNDDNRPMSGGTTGGVFASPVWHSVMSVVHTDMNIPTIPGLEPHPVQVAEQQRIAAMRPEGAPDTPEAQRTTSSLMSDQAREALRKVAQALRKAGGIAEPPPVKPPTSTGTNPAKPAPPAPPSKRADGTSPGLTDQRRTTLGVAQPPLEGTTPRAVP